MICTQTLERMDHNQLSYEDMTPYLFLHELLIGFQTHTSVRHVIIDEVQDYSPFQLEFLKRLFPRSRMTALGDCNQAIYTHVSVLNDYEPMLNLFGAEHTELIRLTRSYRSTREIVEFTRGMVEGGDQIIPFNRDGDKPTVFVAASVIELHEHVVNVINDLKKKGYESIAIIGKTAAECAVAYQALQSEISLTLITKYSLTFEKGVLIIPAYLAKGVEFDAVVIYNGSSIVYSQERDRKLFYTACTRAMHLLHIGTIGQVSPFVAELADDTYRVI
ncbi:Helicase IV [compost metagenome]